MCGVVGSWRKDGGTANPDVLTPMLAAISHRGPDDFGLWQGGCAALAHNRLTILDLTAAGHQPMVTEDGRGVLAYNGEVYNYRELRMELEAVGIVFKGTGDTEVVLHALHHWGPEAAIPRFNGMFAFAYIDLRAPALWLSRDRVGIKPMLVAEIGSDLLFASEAKALVAHPRLQPKVNDMALARTLVRGTFTRGTSLFEGIEEVEPGTWWKVSGSRIERGTYFDLLTAVDVERLVAAERTDPLDFASAFAGKLKDSVDLHMVSDVPVAAMCSGGVDSSLITAYARERHPEMVAYVADAPIGGGEGEQAERVGRHLGVEVRRVPVDREGFLRIWPETVWHCDRPSEHPSNPALLAVARTCRADGIKVLLTGEGSDELFGGYSMQQNTYRLWQRHIRLARWLPTRSKRRKLEALQGFPLASRIPDASHTRLAMGLGPNDAMFPRRLFERLAPVTSPADRAFLVQCLFDIRSYLPWILNRHDRMGMAASIEMRVPFLQNDLFDFAFHLPRRAKLHRGEGKWLVKQAALAELPRDVTFARKKGFPMPADYTRGTEKLLVGGMLAEHFGWSSATMECILADLAAQSMRNWAASHLGSSSR